MLFSVNFSKCSEKNPFPTLVRCYQRLEVGQKSQKTDDGSGVMTVDQSNQTKPRKRLSMTLLLLAMTPKYFLHISSAEPSH